MRSLLVQEEQWQRDRLLPKDWLYKVKLEGQSGKHSDNLTFLSPDCETFESVKHVMDHLKESDHYTEQVG